MDIIEEGFCLVDNFESQKKMVKEGEYVAVLTPFEYKRLFKDDEKIDFFDNKNDDTLFCYLALYRKINADGHNVKDFLTALKLFIKE